MGSIDREVVPLRPEFADGVVAQLVVAATEVRGAIEQADNG
jgi:hypothetical protein